MTTKKPIPAAFDSSKSLEERYTSLQTIITTTAFKRAKLDQLLEQYQQISKALQRDAVERFKNFAKTQFMEAFKDEISSKKYSHEFLLAYTKLEEMENHGCYILKGVSVIKQDCNICNKHCKVKEILE